MSMMVLMLAVMMMAMMVMMEEDNDDDDDDDDWEKAMGRRVVRRGVDPKGLLPSANARRPDLFDDRHGDDDDGDNDGE